MKTLTKRHPRRLSQRDGMPTLPPPPSLPVTQPLAGGPLRRKYSLPRKAAWLLLACGLAYGAFWLAGLEASRPVGLARDAQETALGQRMIGMQRTGESADGSAGPKAETSRQPSPVGGKESMIRKTRGERYDTY